MYSVVVDDDHKSVYYGDPVLSKCLFDVWNNGLNRVRLLQFDDESSMRNWIAMAEGKYRYSSQPCSSLRWLVALHKDMERKLSPTPPIEEKVFVPF